MTTEADNQLEMISDFTESVMKSITKVDPQALDWLLQNGAIEHQSLIKIKDKWGKGEPLEIIFYEKGIRATMKDDEGREFSYWGSRKFDECVVLGDKRKSWGIAFIDDKQNALLISERGTFQWIEGAEVYLDMYAHPMSV